MCDTCAKAFPEVIPSYRKSKGLVFFRKTCVICDSIRKATYPRRKETDPKKLQARRVKGSEYAKQLRSSKNPYDIALVIKQDSNGGDAKRGWTNDLTTDWIMELLGKGCCYCGETSGKLTLDRVDNSLPHITSNVVPACIRCNLTRKNMPYLAWLVVAKGMREARELGLFGDWRGGGNTVKE